MFDNHAKKKKQLPLITGSTLCAGYVNYLNYLNYFAQTYKSLRLIQLKSDTGSTGCRNR